MSDRGEQAAEIRFVVRLTGGRRRGVRRRVSQRLAARLDIPVERVQSLLRRPDGVITRPLPYETAREIWMLFMYEGLDAEMDEIMERQGQEVDLYKTSHNLRLTSVVERPMADSSGSVSFPSAESFFGRSGTGWEQPPSEAKSYTVRLIVRVPPPMLEHVVRRLERHLSIDPERLRTLLQRPPGPITKAVTRPTAERLTSLLTAEGLVVETIDLDVEEGDASLTDTAYRDLRLTMERPVGRPPPAVPKKRKTPPLRGAAAAKRGRDTDRAPTPVDPSAAGLAPPPGEGPTAATVAEERPLRRSQPESPRPVEVTTPVSVPSERHPRGVPAEVEASAPSVAARREPPGAPTTPADAPAVTPTFARLARVLSPGRQRAGRLATGLASGAIRRLPWIGLALFALFARLSASFASNVGMILHLLVSTLLLATAASLSQRERLRDLITVVAALPLLFLLPLLVHAVRPWSDFTPALQGVSVAGMLLLATLITARVLRYDLVAVGIGTGTLLQSRLEEERRPRIVEFRLRAAILALRALTLIAFVLVGAALVPRLASLPGAAPLIGEISLVVVAFTVAQELLFRGVLQRAAVRAFGAPVGLLFATLAFVAAVLVGGDAALASLPLAALFGAGLALAAHLTGSIWGGVALQLAGALILSVGAEPLLACTSTESLLNCLGSALDGVEWIP